ncbi:MAG: hypothetical protein WB676_19365 [Bryobacteraceae bacterium]
MFGERFAQFMELRGRRIVEAAGALWYSTQMRIYMKIPFHEPCNPSADDLRRVMQIARALGVRYPSLNQAGYPSGIYVCRQTRYDLSCVHPKQRAPVRRGLEACEIRPIEEAQLLVEGLQCNLDTMKRQNRFETEFGDRRQWKRLVKAVQQCPSITAIGAFISGKLAAYAITNREDGWFHILHQMSRKDFLNQHPNHALTYELTKQAAEDASVHTICYGLVGLSSGTGLDEYKRRFGYEVLPQNSVFWLRPGVDKFLSNSLTIDALASLRKLLPKNQQLQRIESVLVGARRTRIGSCRFHQSIDHSLSAKVEK